MFGKLYEDIGSLKAKMDGVDTRIRGLDEKITSIIRLHEEMIERKADSSEISLFRKIFFSTAAMLATWLSLLTFGR